LAATVEVANNSFTGAIQPPRTLIKRIGSAKAVDGVVAALGGQAVVLIVAPVKLRVAARSLPKRSSTAARGCEREREGSA